VWFIQENITIPVNCKGKDREGRKRRWQLPTHSFIVKFLHNPFYAGAYVYGRRYTSVAYKDGQLKKIYRERKESEEWEVFIRDHHEGYITWQEYEENLKMLRNNQCAEKPNETLGPARGGKALLSGIVRCQLCGRKMHTRHWGRKSTYSYYLCPGEYNQGGNRCQKFSAMSVDPVFEEELFRAIEPAAVQASIEACDIINKRYQEKITYLEKELEAAKYETDRAFAQYNQVDPSNRLVASELERRWNEKLKVLNETQERIRQENINIQEPTKEDIEKIKSLSEQLPEIWRHPDTDPAIKKRIIRTLVEEVLVLPDTSDRSLLTMTIHWKGGIHTQVQLKRLIKGNNGNKTDESTVELLKKLAAYYPDEEIARVFNCHKLKTGRGNSWSRSKVRELRHRNKIPPFERDQDKNIHTLNEAAKRLGVKPHTVRILIKKGIIKAQQIIKYAPFKIESSEIEKESVKTTIKELKNGIPFKSLGVVSKNQLNLFQ
jgi:hypothetical protein